MSPAVYDLLHDLNWREELRARFEADPAEVLGDYALTEDERRLLLDGSFPALAELGMHPLAQMVYALRRTPAVIEQISFRDYLEVLEPG